MLTRIKAFAIVLTLMLGTVALIATPASAGGGGCRKGSNNGFVVSACSSDNTSHVWSDLYVEQVNTARLTGCYVESYSVDNWSGVAGYYRYYPCTVGRHGPSVRPAVYEHWYTHHVKVWGNSQLYLHVASPFTYF